MSNTVNKLSPFILGLALCCYQAIQLPRAYAASFSPSSSAASTVLSPADASAKPNPATVTGSSKGTTQTSVNANIDCPLESTINQTTKSSALDANGVTPIPVTAEDLQKYQSDEVASEITGQPASTDTLTGQASSTSSSASEPVLMAQVSPDDCCGIGGTTTCEVGGVPTGGAAVGGLSPLLGLLGLVPIAAVIPAIDGDDADDVPEPSTIPGIVAGFGLMGILFGRRYLAKNRQSDLIK